MPVGLRSENTLLKILGWTLWSFTLMLGALFVFNTYMSGNSLPTLEKNESGGLTENHSSPTGEEDATALGTFVGIRNAGSWLLSTSALGLLAQLTFFMPRIASLHKVYNGAMMPSQIRMLIHIYLWWFHVCCGVCFGKGWPS